MSQIKPTVTAINAFNDNYIWAVSNNGNAALIDPGDADVCIKYLENNQFVLSEILITHHHNDHTGGINKLLAYAKDKAWQVSVFGPANEKIDDINVQLKENDTVNLTSIGCLFTVLDIPGHTKGHIAYYNNDMLFCGDTLFSGGCGRIFEGTPAQMYQSLTKLANLAGGTLVYCAHEYTQANLTFALAVEPDNLALQAYAKQVKEKRSRSQSTIPTSIALEKTINPFLRSNEPAIIKSAQGYTKQNLDAAADVFTAIRAWKDNF